MKRAFVRLRWQLTLSHLVAIICTLVCLIAAVVVIAAIWMGTSGSGREPLQDARAVATAIPNLVEQHQLDQLNVVLSTYANGTLRPAGGFGGPPTGPPTMGHDLRDVAYIVVLDPSGQPIASSEPAGAGFAPAERDQWSKLAATPPGASAHTGGGTMLPGTGVGPAAYGVAPILGSNGRQLGTVIVASTVPSSPSGGINVLNVLAIFGAASLAVLAGASVFALASASVLAYFLSRGLVARLEQLSRATAALRAGDLAVRVPVQGLDEVAGLQRGFNEMAADLERTLRELEAERDRVAGMLLARRQLVAGVSHELRTPVAIVRGYLESALEGEHGLSPELRADLETMERELARLQALIDQLFMLSRAELGRLALRLGPVDVGSLARSMVETIAPLAWRQGRVQIVAEIAPDLPPAQADADRLAQILSNLLSNARRYTAPGGVVAVSVTAEPESVRIEVRDTGAGIAASDSEHVFEPYYQASDGERVGHDGAGLGLALVQELTAAMDGSVEVDSTPGEGSTFTVRLPRSSVVSPRPSVGPAVLAGPPRTAD
jgi:signal transduction histidine kinase